MAGSADLRQLQQSHSFAVALVVEAVSLLEPAKAAQVASHALELVAAWPSAAEDHSYEASCLALSGCLAFRFCFEERLVLVLTRTQTQEGWTQTVPAAVVSLVHIPLILHSNLTHSC